MNESQKSLVTAEIKYSKIEIDILENIAKDTNASASKLYINTKTDCLKDKIQFLEKLLKDE